MALFDQQPMGPIPARRPILMPPDPELEAAIADPGTAHVELVEPYPDELRTAVPAKLHPSPAVRWLRTVLIVLLLSETILGLGIGLTIMLTPDNSGMYAPRVIALGVVALLLVLAVLLWRYRNRR